MCPTSLSRTTKPCLLVRTPRTFNCTSCTSHFRQKFPWSHCLIGTPGLLAFVVVVEEINIQTHLTILYHYTELTTATIFWLYNFKFSIFLISKLIFVSFKITTTSNYFIISHPFVAPPKSHSKKFKIGKCRKQEGKTKNTIFSSTTTNQEPLAYRQLVPQLLPTHELSDILYTESIFDFRMLLDGNYIASNSLDTWSLIHLISLKALMYHTTWTVLLLLSKVILPRSTFLWQERVDYLMLVTLEGTSPSLFYSNTIIAC